MTLRPDALPEPPFDEQLAAWLTAPALTPLLGGGESARNELDRLAALLAAEDVSDEARAEPYRLVRQYRDRVRHAPYLAELALLCARALALDTQVQCADSGRSLLSLCGHRTVFGDGLTASEQDGFAECLTMLALRILLDGAENAGSAGERTRRAYLPTLTMALAMRAAENPHLAVTELLDDDPHSPDSQRALKLAPSLSGGDWKGIYDAAVAGKLDPTGPLLDEGRRRRLVQAGMFAQLHAVAA